MKRNRFFLLLLTLISFTALSQLPPAQNNFLNCTSEGFSFANHQLVLNTDGKTTSRIFLLRNIATGTVILNHQNPTPGAGAGWASNIKKNNWSAIAANQANFSLRCMLYAPPKFGMTECQSVINACAITPPTSAGGMYWIAENKSLSDILKLLGQKQLLPATPAPPAAS